MNYYLIKSLNNARGVGPIQPATEKESKFLALWQQKQYDEALKTFPDQWVWFSDNLHKESVSDIPPTFFTGIVFSERAFNLLRNIFPDELKSHHDFKIDDYVFVWVSPPIVDLENINATKLNLFTARPSYAKYASERFVDICKTNGFTGREFTPWL